MKSEIDTYQAGRELDALIGQEVFGYKVERDKFGDLGYWRKVGNFKEGGFESNRWYDLPEYSSDDGEALKVVKYLCRDGQNLSFRLDYSWWVAPSEAIFCWKGEGVGIPRYRGLADTIPLSICRAALRVVREDLSLPEWG